MSEKSSGYNKRVAVVYFSAALLIVSVGVRMVGSLMSESGQGLSTLDWIMIGGIGMEFIVLTMYAAFIWSQPDEASVGNSTVASTYSDPIAKEMIVELRKTIEQIQHEENIITTKTDSETKMLSEITSELKKNGILLDQTAKELSNVKNSLAEFVNGAIKEQVKEEVEAILNNLIHSKVNSKPAGR